MSGEKINLQKAYPLARFCATLQTDQVQQYL